MSKWYKMQKEAVSKVDSLFYFHPLVWKKDKTAGCYILSL